MAALWCALITRENADTGRPEAGPETRKWQHNRSEEKMWGTSPDAGRRTLENYSRSQLGTEKTKAEKFYEEIGACHGTEARLQIYHGKTKPGWACLGALVRLNQTSRTRRPREKSCMRGDSKHREELKSDGTKAKW
jgi:hypothetical protein